MIGQALGRRDPRVDASTHRSLPPRVKRAALAVVVGSLLVNAALGIVAILSGDFGDLERRILLTSVCVSVASVLIVACLPALRARTVPVLPVLGVVAALVAAVLFGIAAWIAEPPVQLVRAAGTALVPTLVGAHGSLLSLIRLRGRYSLIARAALALAGILGALAISMLWSDELSGSDWYGRWLGVVALLLAVTTVLVPILSRSVGVPTALEEPEAGTRAMPVAAIPAVRYCPACGAQLESSTGGERSCPHCSARFEVHWKPS